MTDIKRDFLYEFNQKLRDIYSENASIVSVFENIDNGFLRLSPVELPDVDFVNEVDRLIFTLKRILENPYTTIEGRQRIVPISCANAMDQESVRLTLDNPSLWGDQEEKLFPKRAYSLVNEDVFTNYENAFIYQLIKLVVLRLIKIKEQLSVSSDVNETEEIKNFVERVCSQIKNLSRISDEKVFFDNRDREIQFSQIFVTHVLGKEKRYNFCYRFFCKYFKRKSKSAYVNKDFRVLYHNFALIQILYNLNKKGYKVIDKDYYVAPSGKMFIDIIAFEGQNKIQVMRALNGVDIAVNDKVIHVEFAKSFQKTIADIEDDFNKRKGNFKEKCDEFYCAYLSADTDLTCGALCIGYKNAELAINELIKRF